MKDANQLALTGRTILDCGTGRGIKLATGATTQSKNEWVGSALIYGETL